VTRFASCPRLSSAFAVRSVSTTTWCSFPPATASNAVAVAGSFTRSSCATTPLTADRSKPGSGSLNLKSSAATQAHIVKHTEQQNSNRAMLFACRLQEPLLH